MEMDLNINGMIVNNMVREWNKSNGNSAQDEYERELGCESMNVVKISND